MSNGFLSALDRFKNAVSFRQFSDTGLKFGVEYLDSAFRSIRKRDMIVIGAPSGQGKTAFMTNLALANALNEKRIHFFALEADPGEIESRIEYSLFANLFFEDISRPSMTIDYEEFIRGEYDGLIEERYRSGVESFFEKIKTLKTFYTDSEFTIDTLETLVAGIAHETDLVIVDHIHFFDILDDNENRGMKRIIKQVRELSCLFDIPIVLVAHLRKTDRRTKELCPGIDEFHGSSDITKIATRVVTLARGEMITPTQSETYMRIVKNRTSGGVCFYTAKMIYDLKRLSFNKRYYLGSLTDMGSKFRYINPINENEVPHWINKNNLLTPKTQQSSSPT